MFPVGIVVSTLAMASGIGGATFLAPFLILVLRLPPEVAVGTGLITEVFGFASGVLAYAKKKLIDYRLSLNLLMAAVPAAIFGTIVAAWVPEAVLKSVLGVGLIAVALSFLKSPKKKDVDRMDESILSDYPPQKAETTLVTADGESVTYTVCNKFEGRLITGIGGLFVGLISTGLGELNGYFLLRRCRVPSQVSIATSVFIVAITALCASVGHLIQFTQAGSETLFTVLSIVVFSVPGVIVGAQIGSRVSSRIPTGIMEKSLAVLFIIIALLTLGEATLNNL